MAKHGGTPAAARAVELIERLGRVAASEDWGDGLNPPQRAALSYLARANRFSRRPHAVAAYLSATKGTVSQTLRALERKGFALRSASESDGRGAQYDPTPAGLQALENRKAMQAALEGLGEDQVEALARRLEAALRATLAEQGGRAFGLCSSCRHFQAQAPGGLPHRCGLLGIGLREEESQKICFEHEAAAAARE